MEVPSGTRERCNAFWSMHCTDDVLLLPNAWDAASARLLWAAGFPALATTSAGVAYSLGYPDVAKKPADEMLAATRRVVASVPVPVSVDMEAGWGDTPEQVGANAHELLRMGAVGCNIEDEPGDPGEPLLEAEAVAERIRAAREAADAAGLTFVINGRTDIYLRGGEGSGALREAVRRLRMYVEAGARCLFAPGLTDLDVIRELAREVGAPLNVLMGPSSPGLAELREAGARRISIGGSLVRAALALVARAASEMRGQGTFSFDREQLPGDELDELMRRG